MHEEALVGSADDAPTEGNPPGVIVVGMHRSATSLVASILATVGWTPPGEMLGAAQSNVRGHFEDRQMHELHRRLLENYHAAWDLGPQLRKLRKRPLVLSTREETVRELVATFRASGPWMWKNPRATLFIDAWAEQFREAQFVICVRRPSDVVDSMWRRGDRLRISNKRRFYRLHRTARMLSVWHSYNLMAYRFARSHPDRVIIIRIPQDLPRLADATEPSMVDASMIQQTADGRLRSVCALAITTQLLWWRLGRLHDPDRLDAVLAGPDEVSSQLSSGSSR